MSYSAQRFASAIDIIAKCVMGARYLALDLLAIFRKSPKILRRSHGLTIGLGNWRRLTYFLRLDSVQLICFRGPSVVRHRENFAPHRPADV